MIDFANFFKWRATIQIRRDFFKSNAEEILFELMFDTLHCSVKNFFSFVHQNNVITDLFNLFHSMRTENNCGTSLGQVIDLFFYQVTIYRVKSAEWFVKNNKFRLMQYGSNELQLLTHPF